MTETTGAARPGWYPQGDGGERWWDGTSWTERTRDAEPTEPETTLTAATAAQRRADEREQWELRRPYVRVAFTLGLVGVALLLGAIAMFVAAGSGGGPGYDEAVEAQKDALKPWVWMFATTGGVMIGGAMLLPGFGQNQGPR